MKNFGIVLDILIQLALKAFLIVAVWQIVGLATWLRIVLTVLFALCSITENNKDDDEPEKISVKINKQ